MHRRFVAGLILSSLATLAGAGCGSDATTTTNPTPTTVTDTFPGTLNQNGALTFPFVASTLGTVTVTLTTLTTATADPTVPMGMSLGTWDAAQGFCAVGPVFSNDTALQGAVITATVSNAANLCVRAYDAGKAGATAFPITFSISIVHP